MDDAVIRGNNDHDGPSPHFVPKIPKTAAHYLGDSRNIQGMVRIFASSHGFKQRKRLYLVCLLVGNSTPVTHQATVYFRFPFMKRQGVFLPSLLLTSPSKGFLSVKIAGTQ